MIPQWKKQSISDINKLEKRNDFNILLLTEHKISLETSRKEILQVDYLICSQAWWVEKPFKCFCHQESRNFHQTKVFVSEKKLKKANQDHFSSFFYCDQVDTSNIFYFLPTNKKSQMNTTI